MGGRSETDWTSQMIDFCPTCDVTGRKMRCLPPKMETPPQAGGLPEGRRLSRLLCRTLRSSAFEPAAVGSFKLQTDGLTTGELLMAVQWFAQCLHGSLRVLHPTVQKTCIRDDLGTIWTVTFN